MKKLLSLALSLLIVVCLSSCTTDTSNASSSSNSASISSYSVVYGDEVEDTTEKPTIDAEALAKQISVTKYYYHSSHYYYAILVLQNNSNVTVDVNVNVEFLNNQKQTVGAQEDNEYAFAPGTEICMEFSCDTQFSDTNYSIDVEECDCYSEIDTSLNLETSIVNGNKVIAKVTNNGDKGAEFAKVYCIFLKDNQAVDFNYTYVSNSDALKPGSTKSVEINSYDEFDSVLVYAHGRAYKE